MPVVITVPRPLRERLGEDAADSLVVLLNQAVDKTKEDVIALVEEKFERRLTEEISKLRVELKQDIASHIASLRAELKEDIASLRVEMHSLRADLIRWMFLFWVGQLAAMLGILWLVLRR